MEAKSAATSATSLVASFARRLSRTWGATPVPAQLLIYVVVVAITGLLSLAWLRPAGSNLAVWWPVAGIGSAAVVLASGRRHQLYFVLAHAAAATAVNLTGPLPTSTAVVLGLINGVEVALVAVALQRQTSDARALQTFGDLARFVFASVGGALFVALAAGAVLGLSSLGEPVPTALALFPSHGSAILVALLLVARGQVRRAPARPAELLAQMLTGAAASAAVFAPTQRLGLTFLLLLPMLWTAARGSVRWLGLQITLMITIASLLTFAGGGPYAAVPATMIEDVSITVGVLQVLVVALVLSSLVVHLAFASRMATVRTLRERDRELASERDAAVAAERVKSDFVATMSHEIRTPLNAVVGLGGMLEETPLDERQRRYVDGIRTASASLLKLVNDILDLAKIESGRVELEPTVFSPAQLLDEVADLFREDLAAKQIGLEVRVDERLPAVLVGDVGRLRQILLNLVGNAAKFTQEGSVGLAAMEVTGDGGIRQLRLQVSDTGPGMTDAEQRRLYGTFEQGASGREVGGTGLGLAICQRLATQLGGGVAHHSVLGEGTTFWVEVPLRAADAGELVDSTGEGRHIGVAIDHPGLREQVLVLLEQWGLSRRVVTDQALDGPDLPSLAALISDRVEEVDRHESHGTGEHDAACGTRRILLVGRSDASDTELIAETPCTARVTLPLDPSLLFDAISEALLRSNTVPVAPAAPSSPRRVLLVEDNPANQLVSQHMVSKLGHRVDVVANGEEALAALERREYDLVLMDCQMPVMDGFEATSRWRASEGEGHRTPIIALTASTTDEVRGQAREAGMDAFLSKPLDIADLAAAIGRFDRHHDGPPGSPSSDPDVVPPQGDGGETPATVDGETTPPVSAATPGDANPPNGSLPVPAAHIEAGTWASLVELDTLAAGTLDELVGWFVSESPTKLRAIREATLADDAEAVEKEAHGLRGAAATLGAQRLADALATVEVVAAAGQLAPPEFHAVLETLADAAVDELRQLLRSHEDRTPPRLTSEE